MKKCLCFNEETNKQTSITPALFQQGNSEYLGENLFQAKGPILKSFGTTITRRLAENLATLLCQFLSECEVVFLR